MPRHAEAAAELAQMLAGGVKEACLKQALAIVEESGIEALSFREVSRRLGISHQAPYKHFDSRDDILAALLTLCFEHFARHLDVRTKTADPASDMAAMGMAYFAYAAAHPARYRLMFETPMPKPERYPGMMEASSYAFGLLKGCLARMPELKPPGHGGGGSIALDALFVWSCVHGLASILHSDIMATLGFSDWERHQAAGHILARIGASLGVDERSPTSGGPPS